MSQEAGFTIYNNGYNLMVDSKYQNMILVEKIPLSVLEHNSGTFAAICYSRGYYRAEAVSGVRYKYTTAYEDGVCAVGGSVDTFRTILDGIISLKPSAVVADDEYALFTISDNDLGYTTSGEKVRITLRAKEDGTALGANGLYVYVFRPIQGISSDKNGIQVFNGNGNVVFDSGYKYLRVFSTKYPRCNPGKSYAFTFPSAGIDSSSAPIAAGFGWYETEIYGGLRYHDASVSSGVMPLYAEGYRWSIADTEWEDTMPILTLDVTNL